MSTLTVNTGSMFSGKSTLLISQGEKHAKAGQRVLFIKPAIDNRYSESEVVTHGGLRVSALSLDISTALSSVIKPYEYDVVLIDEIQFFNKRICAGMWWLLSQGVVVYASGLDLNYLGDGFETMNEVLAMADKVNKLKGICGKCGKDSVLTGKKSFIESEEDSGNIIDLGSEDKYIPLCRECWFKSMTSGGNK